MRKKKIIGIVLAAVLVAAALGSFAHANPDPVNSVHAHFVTLWKYTPPGDSFTNSEVTGSRQWGTEIQNRTGETLANVSLTLDSGLTFDNLRRENLTTEGPPTYEWSFPGIPVGAGENVYVAFESSDPSPVTFTPGFDASRSVDKTVFLKSEEPQTQTLTITVTPCEEMDGFGINVRAREEEWVNPVITSCRLEDITKNTETIVNGGEFMSNLSLDRHFLGMWQNDPVVDAKYTYVVIIEVEVTPKVDKVEFLPFVEVLTLPKHDTTSGGTASSIAYPVAGMGIWTWRTTKSYTWDIAAGDPFRTVIWRHYSREIPGIEDFYVKDMLIDFDQRPKLDKIAIKASFHLAEGVTYDLSVDDVRVCVDDISVLITIPAGSFVQGKGGDYIFKSPKGVEPKVEMKLNFDKGEWHLKVDKIDASAVDNCDGVDIYFAIGDTVAMEHINMRVERLSYSGPPPPCPVPVPDRGYPGETLDVILSSTYESIQYCMSIDSFAGATAVSFGGGITVNSFTVDSDTQITAHITIAGDAEGGDRDVSVTTPDGTGTLAKSFFVEEPPPCPVPVPDWGYAGDTLGHAGDTLDVTLSGTYESIRYCMSIDSFAGATAVSFGGGITVNSFTVVSDTQITANITIADAAWGSRDVSVITPDGTGTLTNGFWVEAPPECPVPVPDWGPPGETLDVTLSGTYEGIQYCMSIDSFAGATAVSFGDGITVNSFTVDNGTQITANITIAGDAVWGDRDVLVTTPDGTGTLTNGFCVEAPP